MWPPSEVTQLQGYVEDARRLLNTAKSQHLMQLEEIRYLVLVHPLTHSHSLTSPLSPPHTLTPHTPPHTLTPLIFPHSHSPTPPLSPHTLTPPHTLTTSHSHTLYSHSHTSHPHTPSPTPHRGEEVKYQVEVREEMAQLETALASTKRDYEMLRIEFEKTVASNEQAAPIAKELQVVKSLVCTSLESDQSD